MGSLGFQPWIFICVLSPCKEGGDTSHRMPMGRWQAALVALVCPWGGGSWGWPVMKAGFRV